MSGISGEYIYDSDGNIVGATGGKLAALTNKREHGEDFYTVNGRIGGAVKGVKKGFAANPELAKKAGSLGGKNSKRNWTDKEKIKFGLAIKRAWAKRNKDEV